MRKAKETDYWDKVYKRKYSRNLLSVELNGLNNLQEISFSKGITAICGLNGAGKSTIIAAVKDLLGLNLNESDLHKLKSATVNGQFECDNKKISCSNCNGKRLYDTGYDLDSIKYVDCDENIQIQEFNIRQANIEELLEQNEEYELSPEQISDICYLTGKRYQSCKIWEFEDIEGIGIVPFFNVTIDEIEYDSRSMGRGEHFLFYLYWYINKCNSGTIVIIEEPETYISICSQIHFANYLGKQIAEKGIQAIVTTHSPYLLEHVKNSNIRIVSRMGNMAMITKPDDDMMAEDILGITQSYTGTLLNWKWLFLPGNKALEELYREYLHVPENLEKFCEIVGKEKKQIITMLATIDGNDYHDWFEELRKFLGIDGKMLVRNFYRIMQEMDKEIEEFIAELKKSIA